MFSPSVMSNSFPMPWRVARQAPLSMGFPSHEYWSGLPFPSPGDRSDPGIEPLSPVSPALAGGFIITELQGKPMAYSPSGFLCSEMVPLTVFRLECIISVMHRAHSPVWLGSELQVLV